MVSDIKAVAAALAASGGGGALAGKRGWGEVLPLPITLGKIQLTPLSDEQDTYHTGASGQFT